MTWAHIHFDTVDPPGLDSVNFKLWLWDPYRKPTSLCSHPLNQVDLPLPPPCATPKDPLNLLFWVLQRRGQKLVSDIWIDFSTIEKEPQWLSKRKVMIKMSAGKGVFYLRCPWLQIIGQHVSLKSVPSVEEDKEMALYAFVKIRWKNHGKSFAMCGLLLEIILIVANIWDKFTVKFCFKKIFFNPRRAKFYSRRINNYNSFTKVSWDISRSP